ncbi:hypothetical protein F5Y08DRAFT_269801 [Xylaria arbuscula]|nr:hypothetical protein F5Y08DRAFT_269801 [Xylaria arbuscula]
MILGSSILFIITMGLLTSEVRQYVPINEGWMASVSRCLVWGRTHTGRVARIARRQQRTGCLACSARLTLIHDILTTNYSLMYKICIVNLR